MTSRKKNFRRGPFHLWDPAKAVVSERPDTPPDAFDASESPASDSSIPGAGRGRLRDRLTRSGSKILLLLGLRSSKSSKNSAVDTDCTVSIQAGAGSIDPSPPSSPGENDDRNPGFLTAVDFPHSEPLLVTPSLNTQIEGVDTSSDPGHIFHSLPDSQAESSVSQNAPSEEQPPPVAEQLNPTSLNFVDRFSHKISLAFGQPTVIRRTHLRSRPSILCVNLPAVEDLSNQGGDCANDSSDPSTIPSTFGSPIYGHSSPLTPLTTGTSFPLSDKSKLWDEHGQQTPAPYWSPLDEDEDVAEAESDGQCVTILPSIKTVEATSVAKVYLELFFSSISQNKDQRQQRQVQMEQNISSFEFTPEEQLITRHNWLARENNYLRQCRALKTKRCCRQSDETVSLAGYKAIKVLGKGSFGVVRLVKKTDSCSKEIHDNPLAINDNNSSARSNPLNVLISAMEGARQYRRRYMTGEKKEFYAMKVIKKAEMIRNSQEGHIRAERDFLVASKSSRWVVPLIASFQDTNNLYLVMDYMVGGDFLGLLVRKDTLREDWARFYLAEMILCIEEAHRLRWIHRDVKPDNFLISASGHLKISDFGLAFNGHWSHDQAYYHSHRYSLIEKLGIEVKGDAKDQKEAAKQGELASDIKIHSLDGYVSQQPNPKDLLNWRDKKGRRRFAKSVVGTSQYMAPEVIRGEMYDGRCDWWSLGIILYECLYGFTPFACKSRHETKTNILKHEQNLRFPRERSSDRIVSLEAMDLITRLLQERQYRLCSPKYRLNDMLSECPVSTQMLYSMDTQYQNVASYYVYANDATDIKIHPFFRGIRWQDLHLCQPPTIPRVKNWEDTRYFDEWKFHSNAVDPPASISREGVHCTGQQLKNASSDTRTPNPVEDPVIETPAIGAATDGAQDQIRAATKKKEKEKRRPRDKILRDEQMSKTVLDIRQKGAFLGYTYRRPDDVTLAYNLERGRQRYARGQLAGLYA